jgi:phage gpG-like protein
MKANIKINNNDLNELNRKLSFLRGFDKKILSTELGRTALSIERLAKREVPAPTGTLRKSIATVIKDKTVSVVVDKNYAPYVEFGTGTKVDLTDMLKLGIPSSYAAQFKGAGIRKVNLPARPFLFSSARIEFSNLLERLQKKIKRFR